MTRVLRNSVLGQLNEGVLSARATGTPLEPWVSHVLEDRFQAPLSEVRVHTDADAARLAGLLGAEAFTSGTDIFFAANRYHPQTAAGMRLLAHEIAHVAQQKGAPAATGRPLFGRSGDRWERAAGRAAEQVLAGRPVHRLRRRPGDAAAASAVDCVPTFQCHDSFEHRALGDIPTADMASIAGGGPQRAEIIGREIDLMWLWHQNPEAVTEDLINKQCPWIRTVRLSASGLLVTYGELNALPDYIANAATADSIPKEVLLPILQFVRQQSYIELNKLLNRTVTDSFQQAIFTPKNWLPGLVNTLLETMVADALTAKLGIDGADHYQGLLARNACHFAPFSWHRWQASYLVARDLATRANAATDPNDKAMLTHQAWVNHGYGDHFLQDSFAAGHLVNKTLVMQWFIEWAAAATQSLVPVIDWDAVKRMTTVLQPGLAGRALYSPTYAGGSNDPQTAEEQPSYLDRLTRTGVVVGGSGDIDTAYQDYLTVLSSVIAQSSSAAIHDYYNSHSLWVASKANPTPYEVWGDDTLLSGANGGTGAQLTSAAAQMSQESIRELLANGTTSIAPQQIRDQFPTQVQNTGALQDLQTWNDAQRPFCNSTIFPGLHDIIVRMTSPLIANVSQDQDLTARWNRALPSDKDLSTTTMLAYAGRVFAGSNGYVYELDAITGEVLQSTQVSSPDGSDTYETRMSTDGTMLFAGVHGGVAAVNMANWSRVAWSTNLNNVGTVVDVVAANGRLYAGSNGYVYDIDPGTGRIAHSLLLGSQFGMGDYTMRLAVHGSTLIAGSHGWVYGIQAGSFDSAAWSSHLSTLGFHPVEVMVHNDSVLAGCNGSVYQLDPTQGDISHSLLVADLVGVGDYTTTLAANGQMVFAGTHGYVYGISQSDWSKTAWSADLAGNRYTMVNLAATDDQLVAGSYGYVFRIDPVSGSVVRSTLLTLSVGVGIYETRVVFDPSGSCLFAGVHGYAYRISSEVHSGSVPPPNKPLPGTMYSYWSLAGMAPAGNGYDITYGTINNYGVPAGYNDHCTVIVRGADGAEKGRAAAPGTSGTVHVTASAGPGDIVDYYLAAPDGTNWATVHRTADNQVFEFWKIRSVGSLADGYLVTYGADRYNIPAGYNDHCFILVNGPDGKEKGRTSAPGLDGTVKIVVKPEPGDHVIYYLAAKDGTNWGVAGFAC